MVYGRSASSPPRPMPSRLPHCRGKQYWSCRDNGFPGHTATRAHPVKSGPTAMLFFVSSPFVATSLEVIPPLARTKRGCVWMPRTMAMRLFDTRCPIARLHSASATVTSLRLVNTTTSSPACSAVSTPTGAGRRYPGTASRVTSAGSSSVFTKPNVVATSSASAICNGYCPENEIAADTRMLRCRTWSVRAAGNGSSSQPLPTCPV